MYSTVSDISDRCHMSYSYPYRTARYVACMTGYFISVALRTMSLWHCDCGDLWFVNKLWLTDKATTKYIFDTQQLLHSILWFMMMRENQNRSFDRRRWGWQPKMVQQQTRVGRVQCTVHCTVYVYKVIQKIDQKVNTYQSTFFVHLYNEIYMYL